MAGVQKSINTERLQNALRETADLGMVKAGARRWLELLKDVMSVLVTHVPHKMEFKDAEHLRKFRALVALGIVEVPYVRTGDMEFRGWDIDAEDGTYRLFNREAYAQQVHGLNQSRYHAETGHKQLAPTAQYYLPRLGEYIEEAGRAE